MAAALGRLPGIGPRSAERLALHLCLSPSSEVRLLADTLREGREAIQTCHACGALTESQPCFICEDDRRDASTLCVVEKPTDVFTLEKAGVYRGRYLVLGGCISPLNGIGPEDLAVDRLLQMASTETLQEVILALPTDVEGDATSYYLAESLANRPLRVTRLARGLPAGSGLDMADEVTLGRALDGRGQLD